MWIKPHIGFRSVKAERNKFTFFNEENWKKKKKYRNHSIADFWADRAKLWNRKMTNPKIEKKKKIAHIVFFTYLTTFEILPSKVPNGK